MLDSTVVFSELMYNPRVDEDREWLELHNQMAVDMDISGWSFDGIDFEFPRGTIVNAGDYLVVAKDPTVTQQLFGISAYGPYEGRLSNSGESIQLINNSGRIMDEIDFGDEHPWPVAADGSNATLAKFDPNGGTEDVANWVASERLGGTPGAVNFPQGQRLGEPVSLVAWNQPWSYDTSGDVPDNWVLAEFNPNDPNGDGDTTDGWLTGEAPVGLGDGFPLALSTTLEDVSTTTYFRTQFQFNGEIDSNAILLDLLVDDGAVVYLNGTEIQRINMPGGEIDADTPAVDLIDTPEIMRSIPLPSFAIQNGENILAIELHQAASASPTGGPVLPASIMRTGAESGFSMVWDGTDGRHFNSNAPPTGAQVPRNYALASEGAVAFSSSDLGTEINVGHHRAENLNDGFYGNANSWIGGDTNRFSQPFAGIAFAEPIDVERIAWGRDNGNNVSDACEGQCTDRVNGTYAVQYTSVANPNADTPETGDPTTGWNSIGFATYRGSQDDEPDGGFTSYLRHEFLVRQLGDPIRATAIRIVVPSTGIASGTAIDEIEVYAAESLSPPDAVLAVSLNAAPILSDQPTLQFNEVGSSNSGAFFVELINSGQDTINLAQHRITTSESDAFEYAFGDRDLTAGERIVVSIDELLLAVNEDDRLFLLGDSGATLLDAVHVSNRVQGRSIERGGVWQFPTQATPGAINSFDFESDIVINELMYHPPAHVTDTIPAQVKTTTLLGIDETTLWRYRTAQQGLPTDWAQSEHQVGDDGWQIGPGLIGFEASTLARPLRTQLARPADGLTTYYFEREFDWSTDTLGDDRLSMRHMIDDGAVIYVNGHEIHRFQLPEGPIDSSTTARSVRNAELSDFIAIPSNVLQNGSNRISVEVHQATPTSNDLVFGLELFHEQTIVPAIPGIPYTESSEEWIEIYNRSDSRTVDLSGWSITDAVDVQISNNVTIGPQEYRILTNQSNAFQEKYPELVDLVIGSYEGRLSNQGEQLTLLDSRGNTADELRYYDAGRWHDDADGDGSSLELKDPNSDNRRAEAWAASDESTRSEWQTISYRGTVRADGFTNGVTSLYHEFIFGMLDSGQVLIDDVSVVEDPDGVAIERIQNGSFESDAVDSSPDRWRIAGNHHGLVVIDPDQPSNQVLQLTATGAAEDRRNHAETTFGDGARITIGATYEISFRAKWVSGSNQLNSHLYFDRLSQSIRLPRNAHAGTPGRVNSQWIENAGPTFDGLQHEPIVPNPGEPVEVAIEISDNDLVENAVLWYAVDSGAFSSVPMSADTNGRYRGLVPGQSAGQVVQFYVQALDGRGAESYFPHAGPESRALFVVDDEQNRDGLHNFRIVMTPDDADFLHERTNVTSNDRLGSTVIYNNKDVFYDTGVRLKGSNAGRGNDAYLSFNVAFDPSHKFRGVHDSVAIDRSGRSGPTPLSQDEIIIKHIANQAGDIPHMYDDLVHLIAPNSRHSRTALLMMARYNDVFLDSQYENGSEGTVFKLDIAYVPNSTVNSRDPETEKIPFPYSHPTPTKDFEYLGEDKELYRSHLLIRNNRDRDDYDTLIEATRMMGLGVEEAHQVIDVDQWARVFALQSLTGAADVYTRGGLHHNISFYVRPSDQRILALPWDWDFAFTGSSSQALIGTSGTAGQLMNRPGVRRLYYGHLLDIMETTFNNQYLNRWIDHYGEVAGQNYNAIKTYVSQREAYVRRRLPDEIPFAIEASPERVVLANEPHVTLQGQGWIDVHEVRNAANGETLALKWENDSTWNATLPFANGRHQVTLIAYDRYGEAVGESSIELIVTIGDLNDDQTLDVNDIDLSAALHVRQQSGPDLNGDGDSNEQDYWYLVQEIMQLPIGDANLDGQFDSSDLVQIFQIGEYEDTLAGNSTWSEGDWNGDGDFTTRDLVFAFSRIDLLNG